MFVLLNAQSLEYAELLKEKVLTNKVNCLKLNGTPTYILYRKKA